jgi:hypothetical protein
VTAAQQLALLDVSAASGLVVQGRELYVVADDEQALRRYSFDGRALGACVLTGEAPQLPVDPVARKKLKPDFESLARLPDGRLLALGSGSRKRRRRGALVGAGLQGVHLVDLAPLYSALGDQLEELNIEGAAAGAGALVLAHRAVRPLRSALIFLDLATVLGDLSRHELTSAAIRRVAPVELGALEGLALHLTDLAFDDEDRLHFTAAAEDTDDVYEDGRCAGSVVGRFDPALATHRLHTLPAPLKIEGLAYDAPRRRWLMVADADDPKISSPLLAIAA